jgi:glutathionylspermidine synthase
MTIHTPIATTSIALVPLAVDYPQYRRDVIFRCCKWDPQVDDVSTIADHACVLSAREGRALANLAESLAAETLALESALFERPELWRTLGLGRKLRAALTKSHREPSRAVRVMRFDFHPTEEGWALSEVNSDVPGGFAESRALPELAARFVPGARPFGNAAEALVEAFARRLGPRTRIAFVHATAFADDRQVMQFLAQRFAAAGFETMLSAPDHLVWQDGRALSIQAGAHASIDGIVRFFPAEWLPALPSSANWQGYFEGETVAANPASALLVQSKRLPLLWDKLGVDVPVWRSCLPETRDPRALAWQRDETILVKPAFGRVGEGIAWRGGVSHKEWRRTLAKVALFPRGFVAQRRFASKPLPSRDGLRHLCIGVFTIDGKFAGFYGRLSARPTIEKHAQDVAVLVREEPSCP